MSKHLAAFKEMECIRIYTDAYPVQPPSAQEEKDRLLKNMLRGLPEDHPLQLVVVMGGIFDKNCRTIREEDWTLPVAPNITRGVVYTFRKIPNKRCKWFEQNALYGSASGRTILERKGERVYKYYFWHGDIAVAYAYSKRYKVNMPILPFPCYM